MQFALKVEKDKAEGLKIPGGKVIESTPDDDDGTIMILSDDLRADLLVWGPA